ncbi:MAG: VWA domain-containing protein [Myxococcaceae bacterium]|nr:VWA domain-containing protein [Myxococcaceae bacterium]
MNRTALLLVSAAVLCALALTAGKGSPASSPAPAPVTPLLSNTPAPSTIASNGVLTLTADLSSSRVLTGTSVVHAKVDVRATTTVGTAARVPVNLAVAIDHSGSMSNGKMQQAKRAATSMVDALREGDRLAIISFDDTVTTFPSTAIDDGSKARMREFISRIYEAGSTNISGALTQAYAELRPWAGEYKVSRVVLLSDGQPTAGITDPKQIALLAQASREHRISTSAFGIGLDYNAALMSDLANGGGGSYRFVEDASRLGVAFASELGDASQLVARDVSVSLEVPPGVSVDDVPGHTFTRSGSTVTVPLYDFGPGQSGQLLVRLLVSAPGEGTIEVLRPSVRFVDVRHDAPATLTLPLTAQVTPDIGLVAAATNANVDDMAKNVDMAKQVRLAQAAYESGDTKSAFDILGNVRSMFGMRADALAGADTVQAWKQGGDAAKRVNMGLTQKTMQNFGQNNAY